MSVIDKKQFYQGQLSASASKVYEAENVVAGIDAATVCNTTAGAETITVNIVASGGAASSANTVINAVSIAAGDTQTLPALYNHAVPQGYSIYASASTGAALTLTISGREQT